MSAETDFARGRRETFEQIRTLLEFDLHKLSHVVIEDSLAFGESTSLFSPFRKPLLLSLETMRDHCVQALNGLKHGETVYDLTGQKPIATYRPITDGDYNAGVLSAAEDMKVMLFSLDSAALARDTSANLPDTGPKERLQQILDYAHAYLSDIYLLRFEERIVQKTKRPTLIAYEGEAVQKLSLLNSAFNIFTKIEHPLGQLARRSAKIDPTWPPLKVGPASLSATVSPHPKKPAQKKPLLPINKTAGFKAGYYEALDTLFTELQKIHFQALQNDYTQKTGTTPSWKQTTDSVAKNAFANLREEIIEAMKQPARGKGASKDRGREAALDWVQDRITHLSLKGGVASDPAHQRALTDLKSFWSKSAAEIIMNNRSNKKPPAPGTP